MELLGIKIRIRHRAPLTDTTLVFSNDGVKLTLHDQQRAITAGQPVVIYDGDICLGGGIVA